jgi:hypothetical protein
MAQAATAEERGIRQRVASLQPRPEDEPLYGQNDPDIREFAGKIDAAGLLEPLVVTVDRYTVSGHRRPAALALRGRAFTDCRALRVRRCDVARGEAIALLRS